MGKFQRGGDRGFRGGRGGRGGNRGGGFGGRPKQNWDEPPREVCQVGTAMHPVEGYVLVKNELPEKVPIFGRPVYINDKVKIGVIDDVLGPINEFMFSVLCDANIKPTSIKSNEKIYMNVEHFLTLDRFLPRKPGDKTASRGRGGARGGARGGFRPGGNRGGNAGGFRPQRGGASSGGFRPQRGGASSGGYRPPRGGASS